MGVDELGGGRALIVVGVWLLILASVLVYSSSYFVSYPPVVIIASLAVLFGVIVFGTLSCFRRARRSGTSFFRAVRESARQALAIMGALF